MTDVSTIRSELRSSLSSISELATYDTITENAAVFPAVVIGIPALEPDLTFGAQRLQQWTFPIYLLTAGPDAAAAVDSVDALLSPSGSTSIKATLETDRSLSNNVESLLVRDFEPFDATTQSQLGYIGGTFSVEVWAR